MGVPHYSIIEGRAHELGQPVAGGSKHSIWTISPLTSSLGQMPQCGTRCDASRKKRQARSVDGTLPSTSQLLIAQMPSGLFSPSGRRWALTLES